MRFGKRIGELFGYRPAVTQKGEVASSTKTETEIKQRYPILGNTNRCILMNEFYSGFHGDYSYSDALYYRPVEEPRYIRDLGFSPTTGFGKLKVAKKASEYFADPLTDFG